jgi:L-threonylcarbamoyladenylate synthase
MPKPRKPQQMDFFYEVDKVIETIRNDGLILFPTDTVWKVGCDATNILAIERVKRLTQVAPGGNFTLLVNDLQMLKRFVGILHPRLETLLVYHQRPLTVLYDQPQNLPAELLDADDSIAIRITMDNFCQQLISRFGKPILSVSANVAGKPYPKYFGAISSEIIEGVDYVVRHRQKDKNEGEHSVLVRLSEDAELVVVKG